MHIIQRMNNKTDFLNNFFSAKKTIKMKMEDTICAESLAMRDYVISQIVF